VSLRSLSLSLALIHSLTSALLLPSTAARSATFDAGRGVDALGPLGGQLSAAAAPPPPAGSHQHRFQQTGGKCVLIHSLSVLMVLISPFFPARLESVFFSGFEHALTLFHLVPIYFALIETFISTSFDHRILKAERS
jgi:hypothetical protein